MKYLIMTLEIAEPNCVMFIHAFMYQLLLRIYLYRSRTPSSTGITQVKKGRKTFLKELISLDKLMIQ